MMLDQVHRPDRHSRNADSGPWILGIRVGALALAFAALAVSGCANGGAASPGTVDKNSGAPIGTAAPSTANPALTEEIPPGREIAEGGGGPAQYTFREEWRRALAEARRWRSDAYLISGVGDMVNDEGVPSYWALAFIDKAEPDAVLTVEVDPWGKVAEIREVTGDGVSSFVTEHTRRIPYDIIDSDEAVTLGKAALASRYDPATTRDPRIALGFSRLTDGGLYWTYTLFHESTAEYVSAQIDALTGDVMPAD